MGKGKKVAAAASASKPAASGEKEQPTAASSGGGSTYTRFQDYLQTDEGQTNMKMFVCVNSIIMILTMGMPAMQTAYELIVEKLEEWDLMKYIK